ncbi:hypothetical protein DH2020_003610 [Rehmannia glutinosa]|uniref:F-box domain-containing protein n=1 Tax=Rehmannia glutinosa TaxID=99300 RepID=A0ABR0XM27_REHGL
MKHKSWICKSDSPHFKALPFIKKHHDFPNSAKSSKTRASYLNSTEKHQSSSPSSSSPDFSALPYDVLGRIAASFAPPNLRAASLVCRAWRDALKPLREAMVLLMWGKRFKHGRGGVQANLSKALDSFLKGAARGSTLSMVDAGLIYWEMGKKEEAIAWYRRAAKLGDPAAQCNLAISILQGNSSTSLAGNGSSNLASNCSTNLAHWYQRAAKGGYVRAMYNTSLCYSLGEGLWQSHSLARKWMKRAADCGHSKAQFEHGLNLFSEGEMMKAVVYLELATRAGETAAAHVKDAIIRKLSAASRDKAMILLQRLRHRTSEEKKQHAQVESF